jgi:hypothetical protein
MDAINIGNERTAAFTAGQARPWAYAQFRGGVCLAANALSAAVGDNFLKRLISRKETDLDFVPKNLEFVPSGLDFVPSGLDFVPPRLEIVPCGWAVGGSQVGRCENGL